MNLYSLTQNVLDLEQKIRQMIELGEDESLPEILEALLSQGGDAHELWTEKIDNTLALIRIIEGRVNNISAEIERLTSLKKSESSIIEKLKTGVLNALAARNVGSLKTPRFNVSVAKNGGKAPIAISEDVDPDELPDRFVRVKRSVDTEACRKALEAGESLPFAQLGDRGVHLRVK